MDTKEIFAQRLLEIRERHYITRQKAADDLGISRASLEYYEKGKRFPDINTINSIANYYSVSVDYLMGRTQCISNDENLKIICGFLGTDVDTARSIQRLIYANNEYSEIFKAIISSDKIQDLFLHICKALSLRSEGAKELLQTLEKTNDDYYKKDGRELFNIYGLGGGDSIGNNYSEIIDKIDLNEFQAQKCISAIINQHCNDYEIPDKSTYGYDEFFDKFDKHIPSTNTLENIYSVIRMYAEAIDNDIRKFYISEYRKNTEGADNGKHN